MSDKTKPWAEGLTPVIPEGNLSGFLLRNTSPSNLSGTDDDSQGPDDEYEGGILTYLVPAAIVGTVAYFIAEAMMKKPTEAVPAKGKGK